MSSEARGATMTPPMTVPLPSRAMILTKPSVMPIIFARAFAARAACRHSR
jgi:hypothetical protein